MHADIFLKNKVCELSHMPHASEPRGKVIRVGWWFVHAGEVDAHNVRGKTGEGRELRVKAGSRSGDENPIQAVQGNQNRANPT